MESTTEVDPGNPADTYKLWSYDSGSKVLEQTVLKGVEPLGLGHSFDLLSGAAVCDGRYYAVWTDIEWGNSGILSVDLATNETAFAECPGCTERTKKRGPGTLYHSLHCDQPSGGLLAVRSDPGTPVATFSLRAISVGAGKLAPVLVDKMVVPLPTNVRPHGRMHLGGDRMGADRGGRRGRARTPCLAGTRPSASSGPPLRTRSSGSKRRARCC